MTIEIVRSEFSGVGKTGDFAWMMNQVAHARALFIFNDNEPQFLEQMKDPTRRLAAGGGNAIMRPFACDPHPRAAGVPTGVMAPGYRELSQGKTVIDMAIQRVGQLLATRNFDHMVYSWNSTQGTLGSGIFSPGRDVLDYIYQSIDAVASRY